MKLHRLAPALALASCVAPPAPVAPPPLPIAPAQRTLAQEIAANPALPTYAALLAAAGTSRAAGTAPITVFAADEPAFARLAPDVTTALVDPENRALLARFLGYSMVEGALDRVELRRRVVAGGGRATLPTLAGVPLTVTLTGDTLTLTDPDGDRAYLPAPEIVRADGVLHVVNGVVAPE